MNEQFFSEKVVWIVSYPRSGNTWVRNLIANLQYPEKPRGFKDTDRLVPDTHQLDFYNISRKEYEKYPVFLKSHYYYLPVYHKVIYVIRDGRDVLCSDYYYELWRRQLVEEQVEDFSVFFDKFIQGYVPFGAWKSHVNFWINEAHGVEWLPVGYEDLEKEPVKTLKLMAAFSGLDDSDEAVKQAVERSKFEMMTKWAELEGVHPYKRGLVGKSGAWKSRMAPVQKEAFWEYSGQLLESLGYTKYGNT
jgi:estrone sulfotransferase